MDIKDRGVYIADDTYARCTYCHDHIRDCLCDDLEEELDEEN